MRPIVSNLALSLVVLAAPAAAVLPAAAAQDPSCVFTVSMTSGSDVNNIDFVVGYNAADGFVGGSATKPECSLAIGGRSFAAYHDDEAQKKLSVALIRLDHFSAPVPLIGCRLHYDSLEPLPADFTVSVANAGRDGGDGNVVPLPVLVVSKVECPGELPEGTTTTTLPETTTTTLVASGDCGFPSSNGTKPTATDALFALKAAVGVTSCDVCICDINDSGSVGASDALGILRAAVGVATSLDCPPCD